jgi:ubiquinone/menaquinone biosynthesis C-methylase UbiE
MPYSAESLKKVEELPTKTDFGSIRQQLLLTGLKPGMTAADAGGGTGLVTRVMSEIVGAKGRVYLIDRAEDRLRIAKEQMKPLRNVLYLTSDLESIRLDSAIMDYTFSRLVFHSLKNPSAAFEELVRITKLGGKVVVGDLDYHAMSHYPLAPHLETQLNSLVTELQRLKVSDPFSGRKLFSYFNEGALKEIKVHLLPHHLIYGESKLEDIEHWQMKIELARDLVHQGILKLDFDLDSFKNEFFSFFENPSRFSYSPFILVEGQK